MEVEGDGGGGWGVGGLGEEGFGGREYFAARVRTIEASSSHSRRGRKRGAENALDEPRLNQLVNMHLLAPIEDFVRFAESELINKGGRAVYFCCYSNCCEP